MSGVLYLGGVMTVNLLVFLYLHSNYRLQIVTSNGYSALFPRNYWVQCKIIFSIPRNVSLLKRASIVITASFIYMCELCGYVDNNIN